MPELAVRVGKTGPEGLQGVTVPDAASPRGNVSLTLTLVGVVLAAQIPAAISLMDPDVAFEAGHATGVLAANAAAALATAIGAVLLPPRRRLLALVPGAAVAAVMLGASVTLGGHLWDAASALLTAACAWWLGDRLLRALGAGALRGVPAIAIVLGMAVLGLGVLLLGRLGIIAWWSAGVPVLAVGALGVQAAAREGWARRRHAGSALADSPVATACTGLLLLQLGWTVVWLSAPEIQFDAQSAKAYLPQLWAETGSIGPLLRHPILNVTGLAQFVAVPGHALGAPGVGAWLQLMAAALLVATIWWWGRRSPAGPLAALLVALVPQITWEATTAYDDLVLTLGAVALALAALRTLPPARDADAAESSSLRLALAFGMLAGACLWLKLNLLAITGALTVGWIMLAGPARSLARRAAGVAAGLLAIAGPAFALRWIDTGNPVFPTYNTIFKSPHYPLIDEQFNFPFWPHATVLDAFRTPYELVVDPSVVNSGTPVGMYGVLTAALLATVLLGWRGRPRPAALLLWVAVVVGLVAWWLQFRYLRYLLPIGTLAVLATSSQLSSWRVGRSGAALLVGVAALASIFYMPSTVATFWNVPHRDLPFAAAFGRWDAQDYLGVAFPEKPVLDAFDRMAPRGASALSDAHQQTWLHGRRDLSAPWETDRLLALSGAEPATAADAVRRLRALGVTWAMVNTAGTMTTTYRWVRLVLRDRADLVFSANGWNLYRLVQSPSPAPGRRGG